MRRPWRRHADVPAVTRRGLAGRVAALAAEPDQLVAAPGHSADELPSHVARARFVGAVAHEVDSLRSELSDEILWSLLALDAGDVDGAASILGTGSDRLVAFRQRVERAIAAAAVEREAERVIASAPRAEPTDAPRPGRVRAVGVAFASVAGITAAVALISAPPVGGDAIVSAGHEDLSAYREATDGGASGDAAPSTSARDVTSSDTTGRAAAAAAESAGATAYGSRAGASATSGAVEHDMLELLREPEAFIANIPDERPPPSVAALLDVDLLMARLAPYLAPEVDDSLAVDVQDTIASSPEVVEELASGATREVTGDEAPATAAVVVAPRVTRAERERRAQETTADPTPSDAQDDETASPEPSPTPEEEPSPEPSEEPTNDGTEPTDGDGRGDGDSADAEPLPLPTDGDL